MSNIDTRHSLYDITKRYPETITTFVQHGFDGMDDRLQREGYGRLVTLEQALTMKRIDAETFIGLLEQRIEENGTRHESGNTLSVTGLLPCPVRMPLLETFDAFCSRYQNEHGVAVAADLRAASMGTQWIDEHLQPGMSKENLPDLFLSAGFSLFFDRARIGGFRDQGLFSDLSEWNEEHPLSRTVGFRDPKGIYSLLALVPAVFLINEEELGGRRAPETWEQLLDPLYTDSVSLSVGDFDLFHAILLTLARVYGDTAVNALSLVMLDAMHPSQMVKSDRASGKHPAVTVMPYFFSKMVRPGSTMKLIWPADGAIISPIFMLAKRSKKRLLRPLAHFFASRSTGEIFSRQGLFPSLHPEVTNRLPDPAPMMWLGWDYINTHDLSLEIERFETSFFAAQSLKVGRIG